jgi:solute carrier family 35, member E1
MDIKEESILPLSSIPGTQNSPPLFEASGSRYTNGYAVNPEAKKSDEPSGREGRKRGASNVAWLPPGTRQEETWRPRELNKNVVNVAVG